MGTIAQARAQRFHGVMDRVSSVAVGGVVDDEILEAIH